MENFTPVNGLIGGGLIGLSAAFFLLAAGRITGISGIMEGFLKPDEHGAGWRIAYLAAIPAGALLVSLFQPTMVPKVEIGEHWTLLAAGGLIAGFGARISNGCTSGHGICGVARLSKRSIAATVTFFAAAAATVYVYRHLL